MELKLDTNDTLDINDTLGNELESTFDYLNFKDKLGNWLFSKDNLLQLLTTDKILPITEARRHREELERYFTKELISSELIKKLVDKYDLKEKNNRERYRIIRSEPYKTIVVNITNLFTEKQYIYKKLALMINSIEMTDGKVISSDYHKHIAKICSKVEEYKKHYNIRKSLYDVVKILDMRSICEYIVQLRIQEISRERFGIDINVTVPISYTQLCTL